MAACVEDEIVLLESVFSAAHESVEMLSTSPNKIVKVILSVNGRRVDVTFEIAEAYPEVVPSMRVSCESISRQRNCQLAETIASETKNVDKGQPMLFELCTRAKEIIEKLLSDATCDDKEEINESESLPNSDDGNSFLFALTEIDHMRDRKNYLKILAQWANDLSLQGTVIFCNSTKRILLILASSDPVNGSNYFKEFHVKLRTTNVDVDSAGRPCKERMATVLSPSIKINRKNVFKEFSVVQIPNKDAIDLETFFHQLSLEDVYKNYFKRS